MTRKHFRAIAEALKISNASLDTCRAIAQVCREDNPNFDTYKFLQACGH